jgi:hypothetical protein
VLWVRLCVSSRYTVKSLGVWGATYPFTLGLPLGVTFYNIFYYTSFCTYPRVGYWCQWLWWIRLCVSRDASPDVRWSPLVFGKQHIHSHLAFPQELCSTAPSITRLSARIELFVLGCQELWVGIGVLSSMWCELLCSLLMFWAIIRFMGKM